jgi:hypothetical protein
MSTSLENLFERQNPAEQAAVLQGELDQHVQNVRLGQILGSDTTEDTQAAFVRINQIGKMKYGDGFVAGLRIAVQRGKLESTLAEPPTTKDFEYGRNHFSQIGHDATEQGATDDADTALAHGQICLDKLADKQNWSKRKHRAESKKLEHDVRGTTQSNVLQRTYGAILVGATAHSWLHQSGEKQSDDTGAEPNKSNRSRIALIGALGAVTLGTVVATVASARGYHIDTSIWHHYPTGQTPHAGATSASLVSHSPAPSGNALHIATEHLMPSSSATPHLDHSTIIPHGAQLEHIGPGDQAHQAIHHHEPLHVTQPMHQSNAGDDLYSGRHVNLDDGHGIEALGKPHDGIHDTISFHIHKELGAHATAEQINTATRKYMRVHHISVWMSEHLPIGWRFKLS